MSKSAVTAAVAAILTVASANVAAARSANPWATSSICLTNEINREDAALCHALRAAKICRLFTGNEKVYKKMPEARRAMYKRMAYHAPQLPKVRTLRSLRSFRSWARAVHLAYNMARCVREGRPVHDRYMADNSYKPTGFAARLANNRYVRAFEKTYDKVVNALGKAKRAIKRKIAEKVEEVASIAKSYIKEKLIEGLSKLDGYLVKYSNKLEWAVKNALTKVVGWATGKVLSSSRIKTISRALCRTPLVSGIITGVCSAIIGALGPVCNLACPWGVAKGLKWAKKKFDKWVAKKAVGLVMPYVHKYRTKAFKYLREKVQNW